MTQQRFYTQVHASRLQVIDRETGTVHLELDGAVDWYKNLDIASAKIRELEIEAKPTKIDADPFDKTITDQDHIDAFAQSWREFVAAGNRVLQRWEAFEMAGIEHSQVMKPEVFQELFHMSFDEWLYVAASLPIGETE